MPGTTGVLGGSTCLSEEDLSHLQDWLQLLSVLALAPAPVPRLALSLAVWLPTDAADAEVPSGEQAPKKKPGTSRWCRNEHLHKITQ